MGALTGFNARELASKHLQLRVEIETLRPGTKAATEKAQEAQRFQTDLYRRLYSFMKGDVLPVLATAAKTIKLPAPSKKDLEFISDQKIIREQIEGPLPPQILFHFDVYSKVNTRLGKIRVQDTNKSDAWDKARKRANKKYSGPVYLKIS